MSPRLQRQRRCRNYIKDENERGGPYASHSIPSACRLAVYRKHIADRSCSVGAQLSRLGRSSGLADHQPCVVAGEPAVRIMMALIAQIALGVIIGGLTLALLATGFIMWMQDRKGKERLAIELFVAGAVIVVMLVAVMVAQ